MIIPLEGATLEQLMGDFRTGIDSELGGVPELRP